ncbi:MAG: MBL fold metallo-hydrolase [Proteobacteria bacterium]|nr:MBL fold metallo-hydrolase [Pseudomonadota bacterium]
MDNCSKYKEFDGIFGIWAERPQFPHPANLFIIPDAEGLAMIDVGTGGPAGEKHLLDALAHWGFQPEALHTVVLSHAHPDHMGAMTFLAETVNPRVLVHRLDAAAALDPEELNRTFDMVLCRDRGAQFIDYALMGPDELLVFFERVGCPMGSAREVESLDEGAVIAPGGFEFTLIHTPGHSPGHMSLYDPNRRLLLPGDVVGRHPAWYAPSAGGLTGYLDGLARLESLDVDLILPAHGPIPEDPHAAIRAVRDELLDREARILEALAHGPLASNDLNRLLFPEPIMNYFPGTGMVESHLIKLEEEGRIIRSKERVELV